MNWTKISDSLPPKQGYYIIYRTDDPEKKTKHPGHYRDTLTAYWVLHQRHWIHEEVDPKNDLLKVTHWMPFPGPPMDLEQEPIENIMKIVAPKIPPQMALIEAKIAAKRLRLSGVNQEFLGPITTLPERPKTI